MEIKNKKSFNDLITSLTEEILDEEDLEETTGTGAVAGYNTPFAFDPEGEEKKKKYKKVNEGIDEKDLVLIKKLVRSVVADILRDIWIKRASWK